MSDLAAQAASEIAMAARALIEDPDRWCAGALARDRDGRECQGGEPEAVRWCSLGALDRATGKAYQRFASFAWDGSKRVEAALRGAVERTGWRTDDGRPSISGYQDAHGHAATLALWDAAIAALAGRAAS